LCESAGRGAALAAAASAGLVGVAYLPAPAGVCIQRRLPEFTVQAS